MVNWSGPPPARCDICRQPITVAFIDGRTARGPWAAMCPVCHLVFGDGLGVGRGQLYARRPDNRWVRFVECET